jgi:ankyrin repeat protein
MSKIVLRLSSAADNDRTGSCLILAADDGRLEAVKLLLEAGADPRAGDSDARIALLSVSRLERADIAKELVEARAYPIQADDEVLNAFQEARNRANPSQFNCSRASFRSHGRYQYGGVT